MAPEKEDRRVRKTKRAIRNAFAALLSQNDINKITVKDIADKADINRKTFYNYYDSVYRVLDEIENGIVLQFEELLESAGEQNAFGDPRPIFEQLTRLLQEDAAFYGNLFCMSANSNLREKMITTLKCRALDSLRAQTDLPQLRLEIAVDFVLSGMVSVYRHWFESGGRVSIETLTAEVGDLVFAGVSGMMTQPQK